MSFKMLNVGDDELHALVVMCDYCHERIIAARDGTAVWLDSDIQRGPAEIYHAHKKCMRDFEFRMTFRSKNPVLEVNTAELSHHLLELETNLSLTKSDRDRAVVARQMMSGL